MSALPSSESSHASRCVYCGANQVNHPIAYVSQSLSVLFMTPSKPLGFLEGYWVHLLGERLIAGLLFLFRISGLVRFSTDNTKAVSDRSKVIWEEALRRGIPMEQVLFMGKPSEQYRAQIGGRWHYFMSMPLPPWVDRRSHAWMDNKVLLKQFFLARGVSVPKGGRAFSRASAEKVFDRVRKPVIVKPEIGSRGRHTVTHIYTKEELREACAVAQKLCQCVVVEEHLLGFIYRATYVGGEVVGMNRGEQPRVVGDGVSSIAELVVKKNETKHEKQKDFISTPVSDAFLKRQGYTRDSVLPQGVEIELIEKIGLSQGGFSSECLAEAHPKLIAQITQAGDHLQTPIVGFDVISEDITKDPDTVRWGIIEANSLPFIDLHHFPVAGESVNVAAKVWDLWNTKA